MRDGRRESGEREEKGNIGITENTSRKKRF
jgi:hypothetical protein